MNCAAIGFGSSIEEIQITVNDVELLLKDSLVEMPEKYPGVQGTVFATPSCTYARMTLRSWQLKKTFREMFTQQFATTEEETALCV